MAAGWHSRRVRTSLALVALLAALTACAGDPVVPPEEPSTGVTVTAGSSGPVRVEVADTPEERAVGLMRRTEVPRGTGMVFLYDAPATGKYFMFDVPVPLTAVFALAGRVVHVVDMPPCPSRVPQECPVYGPEAATTYDTVLETAPETLAGKVAVGDALVVAR